MKWSPGAVRLRIGFALAVGLVAGACSSATNTSAPTQSAGASLAASPAPVGSPAAAPTSAPPVAGGSAANSAARAAAAPFKACDLLPADQVKALLGATGTATETDYAPNYEVCQWLTTGSGNANSLRLGVTIKLSQSDNGFAPVPAADSPKPVNGVGDNATYGASGDDTGFGTKLLVVNKGPTSIALSVQYGASIRAPGSTQANMITAANAILGTLGN